MGTLEIHLHFFADAKTCAKKVAKATTVPLEILYGDAGIRTQIRGSGGHYSSLVILRPH